MVTSSLCSSSLTTRRASNESMAVQRPLVSSSKNTKSSLKQFKVAIIRIGRPRNTCFSVPPIGVFVHPPPQFLGRLTAALIHPPVRPMDSTDALLHYVSPPAHTFAASVHGAPRSELVAFTQHHVSRSFPGHCPFSLLVLWGRSPFLSTNELSEYHLRHFQ